MAKFFITGGSGSFGKKYVETLLQRDDVTRIVIYSRDEYKHHLMRQAFKDKRLRYIIGDVRNEAHLTRAMQGCTHVIHAAAIKQVDTAEYNPDECIATNVHGAQNVIAACVANGVERCIALSTDKACNPINLYGATKLCSDKLFVAANNMVGKSHTRFAVVRYGNVVGSRGSVVPFFQSLDADKRTPITHPDMTRFWLTLQQGVDFVMRNFHRMQGGEIFVPKIPSVRMVDVAVAVRPDAIMDIVGIRPGEKMHEAMIGEDDSIVEFDDHFVIPPSIRFNDLHISYERNAIGEEGEFRDNDCAYTSDENEFLTVEQIRSMI